jgi:hypothetical protein
VPAEEGTGVVALGWEFSDVGWGEALGEVIVAAVGAPVVEGASAVGDGATAGAVGVVGDGDGELDGRLGFMFIIMFMFMFILFIIIIMFFCPVGGLPVGRHFELLLFEPLQIAGGAPFPPAFHVQPQLL